MPYSPQNVTDNQTSILEIPALSLHCLDQEHHSFEDHTREFFISFIPDALPRQLPGNVTKAKLFEEGPQVSFATFVEWVLVNYGVAIHHQPHR